MNQFYFEEAFPLETGAVLPGITIAYNTYGHLNADKSNVVWICHALTANSDAADWWPGVVGATHVVDPSKYFIVCANVLGSCYGTTGPLDTDPDTGTAYFDHFPLITIRDMVKAHILLRKRLGIDKIFMLMGGSMGGYQVLEWAVMEPHLVSRLFLLATSATESAWGIATHTAQRLAIEADVTWQQHVPGSGAKGLKAARAIGMLTYRNYGILVKKQTDSDAEKLDNYKASSYIIHQGAKLADRFNAYSYWLLTKAMDSHHLGRGRGGKTDTILKTLIQKTLIIGITSDILCPLSEQEYLAGNMQHATLIEIDSAYGHDGFMVESDKISNYLLRWLDTADDS
ncbi:MAG: homoserine O-acetyltransferase [Chitinophagaceae bacterium]